MPTAPATSRRGRTKSPSTPQVAAAAAAVITTSAARAAERGRDREPGQVDEPVGRRHEEGQVVEPVAVDAPDQGAGHLADRGEADDPEHHRPLEHRQLPGERDQERPGGDAEPELLGVGGEVVEREQGGQVADQQCRPSHRAW